MVPLGVPLPPNSAFLDRRTFVWGLDAEQGAFEWLAEDWGHGEGQDQKRGGSALATSWTPGDPQHHVGRCRKQTGERFHRGMEQRFEGVQALLAVTKGWEKGLPYFTVG